jgi:4-hydroxy-3-methylbut-2-enyl diphosphate reductase
LEIIIAETAGFCFGVDRAIQTMYSNINCPTEKICSLGPIIHNKQVVDDFASKGVKVINKIEDFDETYDKIVIRTHGVSRKIYNTIMEKKVKCIDVTCPYVKKIHKIVDKCYNSGHDIIIIGNPNHPEVIGINGWCDNSAIIVEEYKEIKEQLDGITKGCLVAQTTFNRTIFEEIKEYIKENYPKIEVFDTICKATDLRQIEAEEIAKNVDIVIIIGGYNSSNTQKLVAICKKHCSETYHVEGFDDLPKDINLKNKRIGVTAGASTPALIIKEVVEKMTEKDNLQETNAEMSFAENLEKTLVTLNTGDIVKGTVIGVSENEVYVDLGFKSDGIIKASELCTDGSKKPDEVVRIGDEIEVFVVRVDDGEGRVQVSKTKVDSIKGWRKLESAFENEEIVTGKVIDIIKGGVIADVSGMKVFIPASQISDRYEPDLKKFLDKEISLKIIDFNKRKRNIVGSAKTVIIEEKKKKEEEFWNNIEEGKQYTGTVRNLTSFGAFVDLDGVDGLIHISELSWNKVGHPSEVLKEGDSVDVYILSFDKEKNKVSLGYKKQEDNPWVIAKTKYNIGDVLKGRVVKLMSYGAFVELIPGVDGLIHISQISDKRVEKTDDVLSLGQEVEAKITEMDLDNERISLSIRELIEENKPITDASDITEEKEETIAYKEETKVTIGDIVNEDAQYEEKTDVSNIPEEEIENIEEVEIEEAVIKPEDTPELATEPKDKTEPVTESADNNEETDIE